MSSVFSTSPLFQNFRTGLLATALAVAGIGLSACQNAFEGLDGRSEVPIPSKLKLKMKAKGMGEKSPIMLRIFKQDDVLEVWKETHTGRYALLETYDICKWSGKPGPKIREGDRQAPEGFYFVNKHQLNPQSQYHLAFNMGFPNRYDRAHGRTGSHLMVHGACSSAGCYSMTDEYIEEIYALARESLRGGQKSFQIQAFPFRMTAKNMVANRQSPHFEFWKMLKKGYDHFEITRVPPKVDVCERKYVFNTVADGQYSAQGLCPQMGIPQTLATAYVGRQKDYALKFEQLLARAEGRSAAELAPVTFATLMPGVKILGADQTSKPVPSAATQPGAPDTRTTPAAKIAEPATTSSAKRSEEPKG